MGIYEIKILSSAARGCVCFKFGKKGLNMALIPQIIITTLLVAICSNVHSADLMTLSEEQWFLLNYVVTELIPPIVKGVQPAVQEIIHITIENSKDTLNLASELINNPNN